METDWFKSRQREKRVTATMIAERVGRDRTAVSKILSGDQRMSLEWARAFAAALDEPLAEILKRAGVSDETEVRQLRAGFNEGDAEPYTVASSGLRQADPVAGALGARPGVDVWTVRSSALSLIGYIPGDLVLVDTLAAGRAKAGDIVIAQVYDWQTGGATTVLRRFEPPVLVAASPNPADFRVHVVDGQNVVIRGTVTASWRRAGAA